MDGRANAANSSLRSAGGEVPPRGGSENQPRSGHRRHSSRKHRGHRRNRQGNSGQRRSSKATNGPSIDPLVSGETQFPASLARSSDALQSDAATVNSGSEQDDFESSGDSQDSRKGRKPQASRESSHDENTQQDASPLVSKAVAGLSPDGHQSSSSTNSEDKKPRAISTIARRLPGTSLQDSSALLAMPEGIAHPSNAGPRTSGAPVTATTEQQEQEEETKSTKEGGNSSGSNGSLEVEVYSSGTHSLPSHEMASQSSSDGAQREPASSFSGTAVPAEQNENPPSSGRVSPGGTLYIGRGSRQYHGRYMNLALRRFHHEGVHPDALGVSQGAAAADLHVYDDRLFLVAASHPRRSEPPPHYAQKERRRSRSRSRSPPLDRR